MDAEEHGGEDGQDEDVDIERIDEEPDQAATEEGDEQKPADEIQPGQLEAEVIKRPSLCHQPMSSSTGTDSPFHDSSCRGDR